MKLMVIYKQIILNNLVFFKGIDPLDEAVKMLLDHDTLDIKKLKKISHGLGYPELEKKDIEILNECLDIDRDGKITSKDFKAIFNYISKKGNEKNYG